MCTEGKNLKVCFRKDEVVFSKCCALEDKDVVQKIPYEEFEFSYDYIMKIANDPPANLYDIPRSKDCGGHCADCFKGQTITNVGLGLLNCNLDCVMCCLGTQVSGHRAIEYFYKTFELLKGHDISIDLNLNGELFIQKEKAFEVLNSLSKGDFRCVHIFTNGTLLNKQDIINLYKISKKIELQLTFSIDSVVEDTYLKIRRNATPEMFKHVIRNCLLAKALMPTTYINLTLIDLNSNQEELQKMQEFSKQHNIMLFTIIADTFDERYHYLYEDELVQNFIKNTCVSHRVV